MPVGQVVSPDVKYLGLPQMILYVLIALMVFFSIGPYLIWGFQQYICGVMLLLCIGALAFVRKLNLHSRYLKSVFLIVFVVCGVCYLEGASILGALWLSLSAALLFTLLDYEVLLSFRAFRFIYVVALMPGCAIWFLHHVTQDFDLLFVDFISDGAIPDRNKSDVSFSYVEYPFAVAVDYMVSNGFYRFHGMFDEPGVVGTLSALMVVADRFNFRIWQNWLLSIFGIISFSLAFFLIFGIGILLSIAFNRERIRLLVPIGIAFGVLIQFSLFQDIILDRISISDSGFSGDNRIDEGLANAINVWLQFNNPKTFFFGLNDFVPSGSASVLQIPVLAGLYGVFGYLILYFMIFKRRFVTWNYAMLVFLICFALSIYQRPNVINPVYILVFSYAIAMVPKAVSRIGR